MAMKKKIAIIGMGELGQKHFSELRRSDYFELVALYIRAAVKISARAIRSLII